MEVLGETGLDRSFGAVLEDQTGDVVIASEDLFVYQREHRAPTPLTGFGLKLPLGSGSYDQILQQAAGCDASLEFGICCWVTVTADIAGRLDELVQRDRLDHGTHS